MYTLKSLSEIIGISGYEDSISNYIKNCITDANTRVKIHRDRIGNLILHKEGIKDKPRVMLIAHMDEVGVQVMRIDGDGSAKVKALGNLKTWNIINQRMISLDGQKKGVVYCEEPEGMKVHDFEKIRIISTFGKFQVGDVLGFDSELIETDTLYIGKALDNRVSCYVLCEIIKNMPLCVNEIDFVFSVQEEIGMRGARVAISEILPDIVIDLDVSPIGEHNSLKMGDGIGIKISDSIGVSSTGLVEQIETIAQSENIKYQREVSDCGTSELIITNERDAGAERIGISIPCKNMHSALTQVNKTDLEMCKLLIDAILRIGVVSKN